MSPRNHRWILVSALLVATPLFGGARGCLGDDDPPPPPPPGCRADQECDPGFICEAETCQACLCADVWAPVCGDDGNTYGNACEADCSHVSVVHEGECAPPVECNSDDECAPLQYCELTCAVTEDDGHYD